MTEAAALARFEGERRRLAGLAYRMLGSLAEAEDVLQDAWLRWQRSDIQAVENPPAFLTSVVTRLCLDRLKAAKARREHYVGSWLPEPLVASAGYTAEPEGEIAADLSVALLLALERLSPLERAAFLLHDVFERDFAEVAAILDRSEAACRQLAARARANVQLERPRFPLAAGEGERYARAFQAAARGGDIGALESLLAEQVVLTSDGGGLKQAALNPIFGRDRVSRFFAGLARKPARLAIARQRFLTINGLPGILMEYEDGHLQTDAFEIADGSIVAIYVVRNPQKLEHLRPLLESPEAG